MADDKKAPVKPGAKRTVRLAVTVEHDGKIYPPGAAILMDEAEARRMTGKFPTVPDLTGAPAE